MECTCKCNSYNNVSNDTAFMNFRRKPYRRIRLFVEYDITSNATIGRNFSRPNFEFLSKFCRYSRIFADKLHVDNENGSYLHRWLKRMRFID